MSTATFSYKHSSVTFLVSRHIFPLGWSVTFSQSKKRMYYKHESVIKIWIQEPKFHSSSPILLIHPKSSIYHILDIQLFSKNAKIPNKEIINQTRNKPNRAISRTLHEDLHFTEHYMWMPFWTSP